MKKMILILTMLMACTSVAGCSNMTTPEYTMPEKNVSDEEVDAEIESMIDRLIAQEHAPAELSEDFLSSYLNMESFDELRARTIAGMKATQDTADLTESEFKLWQDIIESERLNQYTLDDLETKKAELYSILEGLAAEHKQDLESFLKDNYGMDKEEADSFIEEQAEKYVVPDEDVMDSVTNEGIGDSVPNED